MVVRAARWLPRGVQRGRRASGHSSGATGSDAGEAGVRAGLRGVMLGNDAAAGMATGVWTGLDGGCLLGSGHGCVDAGRGDVGRDAGECCLCWGISRPALRGWIQGPKPHARTLPTVSLGGQKQHTRIRTTKNYLQGPCC